MSDPYEIVQRVRDLVLFQRDVDAAVDLLTEDVVIEHPFGPPGVPPRIEGREAFRTHLRGAVSSSGNEFDGYKDLAVHRTSDPDVVVIECQLTGRSKETGEGFRLQYVQVIKARDGKIAHWRDYIHIG
jgi:uncharacterized protein